MHTRSTLTRRQLLGLSPALLLALGRWPGQCFAGDSATKEIRFAVFNDLHVVTPACTDWLSGIVKELKAAKEKPAFVVLAGDLTEHGTADQLVPVRDLFKTLEVPIRVVIGNHDWKNDTDKKAYDETFPNSLNYSFDVAGWQCLGLDSSHGLRSRVAVQPATLRWLDDNLGKLDKKKPMIVFTHFPLGPKVTNRVTNAEAVLERFKEYNLRAVFGGHHHGLTERKVGVIELTTNRCCSFRSRNHDGSKQKGYFVCSAKDGAVTKRFVEVKA